MAETKETYSIEPIGIVHSPFQEKFGIPRQAGLVDVDCRIELLPPYNQPEAVDGLEGFSHIWVTFVFHQAIETPWRPGVRPPRLGGNRKVGVFASRAPVRPNYLGLSVVRLQQVIAEPNKVELLVSGIDVVDGTPVVDIKPYISYSDSIPDAVSGFAQGAPDEVLQVEFSEQAKRDLQQLDNPESFEQLLRQVLALDPRPAYKRDETDGLYGLLLDGFNVRWSVSGGIVKVNRIEPQG
ncbi:MAG: tRNA (N6-threonylcarbamoyladenosine(37)-N6)-methyltransferase TrmO [Chromatiales bacterium]|jgi:tRNA-Thr(GGU) m(6)t(6)A37 methyltransferase TsaA